MSIARAFVAYFSQNLFPYEQGFPFGPSCLETLLGANTQCTKEMFFKSEIDIREVYFLVILLHIY